MVDAILQVLSIAATFAGLVEIWRREKSGRTSLLITFLLIFAILTTSVTATRYWLREKRVRELQVDILKTVTPQERSEDDIRDFFAEDGRAMVTEALSRSLHEHMIDEREEDFTLATGPRIRVRLYSLHNEHQSSDAKMM
jgi:hypothetical protein